MDSNRKHMDSNRKTVAQRQLYTSDQGPWLKLAVAVLTLARMDYYRALRGMPPVSVNNPGARSVMPECTVKAIETWLRNGAGALLGKADPEAVIRAWRRETVPPPLEWGGSRRGRPKHEREPGERAGL